MKNKLIIMICGTAVACSAWLGGVAHGKRSTQPMTVKEFANAQTNMAVKSVLLSLESACLIGLERNLAGVTYQWSKDLIEAMKEAKPEWCPKETKL